MKNLLTAALLITAFFSIAKTTAKQNNFTLKPDSDTISLNPGESAVFTINISALNGFDASIFLSLNPGSPQMQSSTTMLTTSIVNAPYTGVKLTVTTSKLFTKGGLYSFDIIGTNDESFPKTATCYIRVIPDSRSRWRFQKIEESLSYKIPRFILQDSEGNYWFNNQKQDKDTPLEKWGNSSSLYNEPTRLPIAIDPKQNKVWLAHTSLGVVRLNLDGTGKTYYTSVNSSLPDNKIYALVIDSTLGTVWVGTRKGLVRYESSDWVVLNSSNSNSVMENELISSIVVSGSVMWIGTAKGLVKYDGKEWKRFTPENSGMPAPFSRVFAVETNGDVWVGLSIDSVDDGFGENETMIGLAKFDGTTWTLFDNTKCPLGAMNFVNAVAIDKKGNKWISTCGHQNSFTTAAGIVKFDNTSWTSYTMQNSPLPGNDINWVGVDNDDNVWFHEIKGEHGIQGFWGVFNENGLSPFLAPPTSVEEQPETTDGITIFPNPTNTSFTIRGEDNILSVKLMNSLGVEVSRKSLVVSGKVDVDVSDLASGIYFVQMRTPTGMITKSIVVSR